jgi:hypothetical protein
LFLVFRVSNMRVGYLYLACKEHMPAGEACVAPLNGFAARYWKLTGLYNLGSA